MSKEQNPTPHEAPNVAKAMPDKSKIAEKEEEILAFWKANNIFEKSLTKESPKGNFVFYEGPPTANAKPALHHLEARAFKDIIPRYKTMRGFHVPRKGGWDTHGLPVELQIEKKLGLKSKKDIESYGVVAFNKACKESVFEYIGDWEKFTDRIGYWVDKETAYYTFNASYMEAVWNVIKNVNDRDLLYKDYRVVPWCTRCGTALSSHELAQGYEEDTDVSVYVKFKVVGQDNTYILAWTTTPWTLPGNVGLAVGEDIDYVKLNIKNSSEIFVIAKERLSTMSDEYSVVSEIKGKDLIGLQYEPLYPYMKEKFESKDPEAFKKAYTVYGADFVTTTDGTGIVHTAVMYGQEDFELGTKVGLPKFHLVSDEGKFVEGTDFLAGRYVKEVDENGKPTLAIDIIDDLTKRNLFFKKENIKHQYPHCWRCKTPLIYYARDSWYIRMSALRDELQKENQEINWFPSHIRDGRFGEWLREVKDWAISRERYWGTPLPVWQDSEGNRHVIGSIDELKKYTKKSGNTYIFMRHGEADHNILDICSSDPKNPHHLTQKGIEHVHQAAARLKEKNINTIITSPFVRAKETAEILSDSLGLNKNEIIEDARIGEFGFGDFNLKPFDDYVTFRKGHELDMNFVIPGGESLNDVKKRIGDFLIDLENTHKNKTILIVAHGIELQVVPTIINAADDTLSGQMIHSVFRKTPDAYFEEFNFVPLPHNEHYELDLHKPFIDETVLVDEKGNALTRTKEVMDVWFDSGAMPFAQDGLARQEEMLYPADYISEAIDQTRGWFYTLHAIGVLMGKGKAYRNVVCLGHILDAEGKKMSKSIGNIVDPWLMMNTYGVDALRMWMYTVNQPGDSKNFDPKTVDEIVKKIFNPLENIISFYEMYASPTQKIHNESTHVLDRWLLALFDEMITKGTKHLEHFEIFEAGRMVRDFVSDFSTWYIRRSRDRYKSDDVEDKDNALATTAYVLRELSKYMAPFMPFFAESMYLKFKKEGEPESVHLSAWPTTHSSNILTTLIEKMKGDPHTQVIEDMKEVRRIVSLALEKRMSANVKVRQPLSELKIKNSTLKITDKEFIALIKDEINVKEVVFDETLADEVVLDTIITPELKKEGDMREFIRGVQELRKTKGMMPGDSIVLSIETDDAGKEFLNSMGTEIQKPTNVQKFVFEKNDGDKLSAGDFKFKISVL